MSKEKKSPASHSLSAQLEIVLSKWKKVRATESVQ